MALSATIRRLRASDPGGRGCNDTYPKFWGSYRVAPLASGKKKARCGVVPAGLGCWGGFGWGLDYFIETHTESEGIVCPSRHSFISVSPELGSPSLIEAPFFIPVSLLFISLF